MSDSIERRQVGDLRVEIDGDLCVGFGDCVEADTDCFALNGDGLAVFRNPAAVPREILLAACDTCPVDAITVWDAEGRQLVP